MTINVRSFGARGDGATDDTLAIQQAADAAIRQIRVVADVRSGERVFPAIEFPAGHYRLTAPIDFGPLADLQGQGGIVIEQMSSVRDSFRFSGGYQVRVSGFTFVGGTTAIRFTNPNVNAATLSVDHCRFQRTTGPAVIIVPDAPGNMSSQAELTGCRWMDCQQAVVTHADCISLSDSWIQWGEGDNKSQSLAAIEVRRGAMSLRGMLFVPEFSTGPNGCRWIDNYGVRLTLDGCRFGGEYGGLPIIHQFGVPDLGYPFQGPIISLRDSQLSSGMASSAESAVVSLRGGLPQIVTVEGCSGVIGPVPLIRDMDGIAESVLNSLTNRLNRMRIAMVANAFFPPMAAIPAWLIPYRRILQ